MRPQHVNKIMEDSPGAPSASALGLEFAELTDTGSVRDHNEDSFGHVLPGTEEQARQLGWLFVLADGVGGHDRGEVASRIAVDRLTSSFPACLPGEPASTVLQRLIQRANLEIYEAAMSSLPAGRSMATTVVTGLFRYDRLTIGHVGDSRCYLIRQGHAAALTRDHTISQEQLRMGLINVRDAAASGNSSILSRSLGSDMLVNVDVEEIQLYAGDVILLCSDGLHHSVKETDLEEILEPSTDLSQAAHRLVSLARQRDGQDNITVQLIRVRTVEPVGLYRGRHYKLR